jgi:hypothetical protein
MLDSVLSVELCSSSSLSDSSGSESMRASPPPALDLVISAELQDILEMPEVEASQQMVTVEAEARTISPLVSFHAFVCFICFVALLLVVLILHWFCRCSWW